MCALEAKLSSQSQFLRVYRVVHTYTTRSHGRISGVLLYDPLPHCLELTEKLELGWKFTSHSYPPVSTQHSTGRSSPGSYVDTGDLNSDPHACGASVRSY